MTQKHTWERVSIGTMSRLAKAKIKASHLPRGGMRISGLDRFNLSIGSGCTEYKIKLHRSRCWSPRGEGVDWLEKGSPSKGPLSGVDSVKQLTSGHQILQPGSCMMGVRQLTSLVPLGHVQGWICPLIEQGQEIALTGQMVVKRAEMNPGAR